MPPQQSQEIKASTGPRISSVSPSDPSMKQEGDYVIKPAERLTLEIRGVTYDASEFQLRHPGGLIIKSYNGRDATDVFEAFHGENASKWLNSLPKVEEAPKTKVSPMIESFRALRDDLKSDGLLDANLGWYAYKVVTTILLGVIGVYLSVWQGWVVLGALFMGAMWQQLGWVGHEFAHNQVFKNRDLNRWFGYFTGNVLQGFDVFWWSDRHNQHHAVPNVLGGHPEDGDPDIDNLPVVAWDEADLARVSKWPAWGKKVLRFQGYYFLFFMPFLRLIWCLQSIFFVRDMPNCHNSTCKKPFFQNLSKATLAIHWLGQLVLVLSMPTLLQGIAFFWIGNLLSGFGTAIVVFFNHHSLEKVPTNSEVKDFPTVQLITTRNLHPSPLIDWIYGGLNYQIEHHLFPTAPRHALNAIMPRVKAWCKQWDQPYYCEGFVEGVSQMLSHLDGVAKKLPAYEASLKNK